MRSIPRQDVPVVIADNGVEVRFRDRDGLSGRVRATARRCRPAPRHQGPPRQPVSVSAFGDTSSRAACGCTRWMGIRTSLPAKRSTGLLGTPRRHSRTPNTSTSHRQSSSVRVIEHITSGPEHPRDQDAGNASIQIIVPVDPFGVVFLTVAGAQHERHIDRRSGVVHGSSSGRSPLSAGERVVAEDAWRLRKAKTLIKLLALESERRLHVDQAAETAVGGAGLGLRPQQPASGDLRGPARPRLDRAGRQPLPGAARRTDSAWPRGPGPDRRGRLRRAFSHGARAGRPRRLSLGSGGLRRRAAAGGPLRGLEPGAARFPRSGCALALGRSWPEWRRDPDSGRGEQPAGPALPRQLTSFIGRERELAEAAALLRNSRLLTLTGAGGCGKTRLALELAGQRLGDFSDGVWPVELAALGEPESIGPAIAQALDTRLASDRAPEVALAGHIGDRQQLLMLDNCEHLVESVAHLVEALLRHCSASRCWRPAASRSAFQAR